jgi:hypothetical protein
MQQAAVALFISERLVSLVIQSSCSLAHHGLRSLLCNRSDSSCTSCFAHQPCTPQITWYLLGTITQPMFCSATHTSPDLHTPGLAFNGLRTQEYTLELVAPRPISPPTIQHTQHRSAPSTWACSHTTNESRPFVTGSALLAPPCRVCVSDG